ncbi:hypothetical protein BJX96DRAFT_178289 [Aspergillus floccosus]
MYGYIPFDYLQDSRVASRFNKVLQQVALQLSHIEADTGQGGLQNWWWEWAQGYFQPVQYAGQGWASDAVRAALGPNTNARAAGKTLQTYDELVIALAWFSNRIPMLSLPPITIMKAPST